MDSRIYNRRRAKEDEQDDKKKIEELTAKLQRLQEEKRQQERKMKDSYLENILLSETRDGCRSSSMQQKVMNTGTTLNQKQADSILARLIEFGYKKSKVVEALEKVLLFLARILESLLYIVR